LAKRGALGILVDARRTVHPTSRSASTSADAGAACQASRNRLHANLGNTSFADPIVNAAVIADSSITLLRRNGEKQIPNHCRVSAHDGAPRPVPGGSPPHMSLARRRATRHDPFHARGLVMTVGVHFCVLPSGPVQARGKPPRTPSTKIRRKVPG